MPDVSTELTGSGLPQHPSPLSAYRGFFGNNHFQAANDWLEGKYGKDGVVDWCKLD